MTNLEKYNTIFCEVFRLSSKEIETARFKVTQQWDSVGHVTLISRIEEAFDVSLDPDDLMDFTSYESGVSILKKYGIL